MKTNKIGAIFPIKERHVDRLFSKKTEVFVKFSNLTLKPSEKIIFYMSKIGKLVGEARIIDIKEMNQ